MAQQPPGGQGLLITEDSRSHSDTPQSVGLLWISNQPDAQTSTWQTHNNPKRQTTMSPPVVETKTPASERPQTHVLHRATTGIGNSSLHSTNKPGSNFKVQSKGYKHSR